MAGRTALQDALSQDLEARYPIGRLPPERHRAARSDTLLGNFVRVIEGVRFRNLEERSLIPLPGLRLAQRYSVQRPCQAQHLTAPRRRTSSGPELLCRDSRSRGGTETPPLPPISSLPVKAFVAGRSASCMLLLKPVSVVKRSGPVRTARDHAAAALPSWPQGSMALCLGLRPRHRPAHE
ncbi:hypothetical protein P4O66_010390 [Electrophorus voltai]|uniref:Uncharacterized protein n=1 Tax=Electrophorus voltai TaxID=2609070 RepID=A0AAD8Z8U9_9TELE|nr:hypothetical protein P4O66_010390 [Electrophorus voltai]